VEVGDYVEMERSSGVIEKKSAGIEMTNATIEMRSGFPGYGTETSWTSSAEFVLENFDQGI
jgi:hypothetical protein